MGAVTLQLQHPPSQGRGKSCRLTVNGKERKR
jgi:hypothetical protein